MPLHLQTQSAPFGSYTDVDLVASKIAKIVYRAGYTTPSSLTWVMYAPQHTLPIALRCFVRFWDDAGTLPNPGGTPITQSSSNPLFEGFVEDAQPTDSNLVSYTAYDPTYESTRNVTILNEAYPAGSVPSTPPVENAGSFPRMIFNATIDNDDDYAYCIDFKQTVAQLLWYVFVWTYQPLYWLNAANGDGSSAGNGAAFLGTDLFGTGAGQGYGGGSGTGSGTGAGMIGLDFMPQEKETFESESVRSAVDRLLRYAPQFKLVWHPGERHWRIFDITASPQYTLTLNQSQGFGTGSGIGSGVQGSGPLVLAFNLHRSLDNRYTAVRFYGPEVSVYAEALVSNGSLTQVASAVRLQTNPPTSVDVYGLNWWQITDPTKRTVARLLPNPYYVALGDFSLVLTRSATLQAYWPASSDGNLFPGWKAILGWVLDGFRGIITTGDRYVYRYNPNPAGGAANYENPTDVKFAYGLPSSPLQVRIPASGYQGTAYTIANLKNELKLYDEMLAIGYEYNNPVTSVARLAQYQQLATYELNMRQDIVYAGGAICDGYQYQFAWLNTRMNFAAKDEAGGFITTGWEGVNAWLTDVEIDYDQQLTSLTFSSDHMELMGLDVEQEKKKLKIRALVQVEYLFTSLHYTQRHKTNAEIGQGFDSMGNVFQEQWTVQHGFQYVDTTSGTIDSKGRGGVQAAPFTNLSDYNYGTRQYDAGREVAGIHPAGTMIQVGGHMGAGEPGPWDGMAGGGPGYHNPGFDVGVGGVAGGDLNNWGWGPGGIGGPDEKRTGANPFSTINVGAVGQGFGGTGGGGF